MWRCSLERVTMILRRREKVRVPSRSPEMVFLCPWPTTTSLRLPRRRRHERDKLNGHSRHGQSER